MAGDKRYNEEQRNDLVKFIDRARSEKNLSIPKACELAAKEFTPAKGSTAGAVQSTYYWWKRVNNNKPTTKRSKGVEELLGPIAVEIDRIEGKTQGVANERSEQVSETRKVSNQEFSDRALELMERLIKLRETNG